MFFESKQTCLVGELSTPIVPKKGMLAVAMNSCNIWWQVIEIAVLEKEKEKERVDAFCVSTIFWPPKLINEMTIVAAGFWDDRTAGYGHHRHRHPIDSIFKRNKSSSED